jgi:sensor histidine kinase YesM
MTEPNQTTQDPTDRELIHPLRVIPWLRKLPDNIWVELALTASLATACGLLFTILAHSPQDGTEFSVYLRFSLVYSFAISYSIHLVSRIFGPTTRIRLRKRPFIVRLIVDIALWVGGTLMGYGIAATLLGQTFGQPNSMILSALAGTVVLSIITGIALRAQALQEINREIKAEREKTERSEVQRTLAMSRLRLLQAQIEPHFLFNTLANVSSLIDVDAKRARIMLDQFTLLLRALLDQTRQTTTTVRKELQVAEAYLSVLKIRMGERLSYQIDAPAELIDREVPGMLLQPIVENAVKHGIEPRIDGGVVRVEAKREDNQLVLVVLDNGVGFVDNSKESIGLGAIRERLAVQYGAAAQVDISRTPDGWTRVAIRIPMAA